MGGQAERIMTLAGRTSVRGGASRTSGRADTFGDLEQISPVLIIERTGTDVQSEHHQCGEDDPQQSLAARGTLTAELCLC